VASHGQKRKSFGSATDGVAGFGGQPNILFTSQSSITWSDGRHGHEFVRQKPEFLQAMNWIGLVVLACM